MIYLTTIGHPSELACLSKEGCTTDIETTTPLLCAWHPTIELIDDFNSPFRVVQQISSSSDTYCKRAITPIELLRMYLSQPSAKVSPLPPIPTFPTRSRLSFAQESVRGIPPLFWVTNLSNICTSISIIYQVINILQSLNACSQNPYRALTIGRKEVYARNKDTNFLIGRLKQPTPTMTEHEIRSVYAGYRHALRENRVVFRNDRLLLFTTTSSTTKSLCLIIVPDSLRQLVFFAYHASGTGAHMKEFKTLLLIQMYYF